MLVLDLLLDLARHVLDHLEDGLLSFLPLLALIFYAFDALADLLVDFGKQRLISLLSLLTLNSNQLLQSRHVVLQTALQLLNALVSVPRFLTQSFANR